MTGVARREEAEEDRSELEQLGDELSRRGMHVTLAPASDTDEPLLEVINPHVPGLRGRRIRWADGVFWWQWPQQIAQTVGRAADLVAAELQWSRQFGIAPPRGDPGGT